MQLLLDDSGKPSMARVCMALIVMTYLGCMIIITVAKGTIPDIPLNAAGLVTVMYGVNKLSPTIPFSRPGENK